MFNNKYVLLALMMGVSYGSAVAQSWLPTKNVDAMRQVMGEQTESLQSLVRSIYRQKQGESGRDMLATRHAIHRF